MTEALCVFCFVLLSALAMLDFDLTRSNSFISSAVTVVGHNHKGEKKHRNNSNNRNSANNRNRKVSGDPQGQSTLYSGRSVFRG